MYTKVIFCFTLDMEMLTPLTREPFDQYYAKDASNCWILMKVELCKIAKFYRWCIVQHKLSSFHTMASEFSFLFDRAWNKDNFDNFSRNKCHVLEVNDLCIFFFSLCRSWEHWWWIRVPLSQCYWTCPFWWVFSFSQRK